MAVIQAKPTSAGRRFVVEVKTDGLHKGDPYGPLLAKKTRTGGRNNKGRITTRHRGGGHKQRYRIIDFKRAKDGITAKVERVEYDPNRSAHIALLLYTDGERRYIIAPRSVATGDELMSGRGAPIRPGNCLLLSDIPVGSTVHCVEFKPGKGLRSHAAPVRACSWLRAKAVLQRSDFGPVNCARYRWCAGRRLARSGIRSIRCVRLARLARRAGVGVGRRCEGSR